MAMQSYGKRPWTFYVLALLFIAFVIFIYAPMIVIYILSFQGPTGGLVFPLRGVSLTWFSALFGQARTGDARFADGGGGPAGLYDSPAGWESQIDHRARVGARSLRQRRRTDYRKYHTSYPVGGTEGTTISRSMELDEFALVADASAE